MHISYNGYCRLVRLVNPVRCTALVKSLVLNERLMVR